MKRLRRTLFLFSFFTIGVLWFGGIVSLNVSAQKRERNSTKLEQIGPSAPSDVPVLIEDFNYAPATLLTANGWTAHSGGGTNPISITSPGLTYPNYPGSGVGASVAMTTTGEDDSRALPSAVSSGSLYAAFMVNVGTSQTAGDYFFHFMQFNTTTFRARVFAKKDTATSQFAFGISRTSGTPVYTGFSYSPGTTYLVVVKYTFVAGASNDVIELFINPTPGAPEPAASLTATDADGTEPANLNAIALRQGNVSNAPSQQVDGIRVGTTWASVTAAPTFQKPNVDMNGDGKSDYIIIREQGAAANGASFQAPKYRSIGERRRSEAKSTNRAEAGTGPLIEWWTEFSETVGSTYAVLGDVTTDWDTPADFDGDNKDDIAIWRPGPPTQAAFYWIRSSDITLATQPFGQDGDNPSVVGDYDADGKDDPAVFRCPLLGQPTGQCYFFYRGTNNNPNGNTTYMPFGVGGELDFSPVPGDYDGDGKYDFCLHRESPTTPGQGQYVLLKSSNFQLEFIDWGLFGQDFLVPGDFDGDGKSDFCVARTSGGNLFWYILERDGGGTGAAPIQFGLSTDFVAPGDYDGDGKQDIAIYRWNTAPAQSQFWVRRSSTGNPIVTTFGLNGDVPASRWYVQ